MQPNRQHLLIGRDVASRRGSLRHGAGGLVIRRQGDGPRLIAREAQQHAGNIVPRFGEDTDALEGFFEKFGRSGSCD